MRLIDKNDWIQSGAGYFGTTYFHKTNPSLLLKMNSEMLPHSAIEEEFRLSSLVHSAGIATPRPIELVTDGKLVGMIYERMPDKVSFARAVGETPQRIPELASMFASMVRLLHSTPCPEGCSDVKDVYSRQIRNNTFRSEEIKKRALDLLHSLPQGDTCLHGDLHFGNAILSGGKGYFIDLGGFCSGYPMFDMGMMMGILSFGKIFPDFFTDSYHCTIDQGILFWNNFLKNYFSQDVDIAAKEKEFLPYLALRQISVEPVMGKPLPDEDTSGPFRLFSSR